MYLDAQESNIFLYQNFIELFNEGELKIHKKNIVKSKKILITK